MVSLLQSVRSLIDPVDGVRGAVESRRWFWPLLLLVVSMSLSSAATFARYDPAPEVLSALQQEGELAKLTEQELADKITTAGRVHLVVGLAKAILGMPLAVLLLAVVLKLTGWLLESRAPFAACFSAAALALLPIAVYHLAYAGVAISQVAITDHQLQGLMPSSLAALVRQPEPRLARVLGVMDFFNLWSAVLLGLGFAAASGMRRPRALALGVLLYLMYAGVFRVGLPGMTGGGT